MHGSIVHIHMIHTLMVSSQAIDGEANRLKSENDTLKDSLRRALKELRAYQLKYPSPFSDELQKNSDGLDVDLPELAVSPEATSALFIAYDIRKYNNDLVFVAPFGNLSSLFLLLEIRELESTITDLHDTVRKCKNNVSQLDHALLYTF